MSTNAVRSKTRNQIRRRKFIEQKLYGLAMLAISGVILYIASKGTTVVDKDATAVLLTAPMGLYLMFTRHIVIC